MNVEMAQQMQQIVQESQVIGQVQGAQVQGAQVQGAVPGAGGVQGLEGAVIYVRPDSTSSNVDEGHASGIRPEG